MKSTIQIEPKNTKFIAHRGLSGIEPENTVLAFECAGNGKYFGIESDVHVTLDERFVMIHDNDTKRVSGCDFSVENTDFETLRNVSLKDKNGCNQTYLRIPTLSEYLKTCKTYNKIAVLEIKNRVSFEMIEKIYNCACKEYNLENVLFISFDYENLVKIRNISEKAKIQFLCECPVDNQLIEALKEHSFDVDIYEKRLDKNAIELFHKNGILVNCWTCDDETRAKQLIDWNIDYITTNILEPKLKEN